MKSTKEVNSAVCWIRISNYLIDRPVFYHYITNVPDHVRVHVHFDKKSIHITKLVSKLMCLTFFLWRNFRNLIVSLFILNIGTLI